MSRWYAARLGVELDTSGSDIGRLCFVSDDPALYLLACLPPLAGGYRRATGGPRPATPYLEGGG